MSKTLKLYEALEETLMQAVKVIGHSFNEEKNSLYHVSNAHCYDGVFLPDLENVFLRLSPNEAIMEESGHVNAYVMPFDEREQAGDSASSGLEIVAYNEPSWMPITAMVAFDASLDPGVKVNYLDRYLTREEHEAKRSLRYAGVLAHTLQKHMVSHEAFEKINTLAVLPSIYRQGNDRITGVAQVVIEAYAMVAIPLPGPYPD